MEVCFVSPRTARLPRVHEIHGWIGKDGQIARRQQSFPRVAAVIHDTSVHFTSKTALDTVLSKKFYRFQKSHHLFPPHANLELNLSNIKVHPAKTEERQSRQNFVSLLSKRKYFLRKHWLYPLLPVIHRRANCGQTSAAHSVSDHA